METLSGLTDRQCAALLFDWSFWARPSQLPPAGADWLVWLILAGRGWGKTRTGAEWVRWRIESGQSRRVALVNDTAADTRDIMVEGPDGLLAVCPPWDRPEYEPSKRRLTWKNGAVAICYAAESPELLRGPQHDGAWADEFAKWKNFRVTDNEGGTAFDNMLLGLRIGNPQAVLTTTPRPIPALRALLKASTTRITKGSTYENRANLAEKWYDTVIAPMVGTRLGRQEIEAEILDDAPGALWKRAALDALRVVHPPAFRRIVVAIDPAARSKTTSDETGLVVVGLGVNGHGYVLEDLSGRYTPDGWASRAVRAYRDWKADRIVAEINQGGEMVEHTLRTVDGSVSYRGVHAARGKLTRAEPVAALYEQAKVHHVGSFAALEDQMCTWDASQGDASPDRIDALVWGLTDLMLGSGPLVAVV